MTVDRPIAINDPSGDYTYDAGTFRRALSALLVHDESSLSARPGVIYGMTPELVGGSVVIRTGSAVVTPEPGSKGSYIVTISADEAPTIPPTSSADRADLLVLEVLDPEISGSERDAYIRRVPGVEGTPAVIPNWPDGALPIAIVNVTTTGPDYVVDSRRYTGPKGSVIVTPTESYKPSGPFVHPGQMVFGLQGLEVWTGDDWNLIATGHRQVYNEDVFTSVESGISIASSTAIKDTDPSGFATVTFSARLSGVNFTSGTQNTSLAMVRPELGPNGVDVPLSGVSGNGSQRLNITNGALSLRWSAEARSSAETRISGAWVLTP